jgi:hypothetical protein
MDTCTWRLDWGVDSVAAFWFNGQDPESDFPPGPGWRDIRSLGVHSCRTQVQQLLQFDLIVLSTHQRLCRSL